MNQHDARQAELAPDASLQDGQLQDGQLQDALPGAEASVVRGGPEWRQLSFRASGLTIELEITGGGDYRRLMGQLIPRQSAVVDIRHGQGVTTVDADTLGRFSAEEIPVRPDQPALPPGLGPGSHRDRVDQPVGQT